MTEQSPRGPGRRQVSGLAAALPVMSFAELSDDVLCQILLEVLKDPAPPPALSPLAADSLVWVKVTEEVKRGRNEFYGNPSAWSKGTVMELEGSEGEEARVLVKFTPYDPRLDYWYLHSLHYDERPRLEPLEDTESWFDADSEKLQWRRGMDSVRRAPPTAKELRRTRLGGVSAFLGHVQLAAKAFEPKIVDEVARCILSETFRWNHGGWSHVGQGGKMPRRRYKGQRWTMLLHELEIDSMATLCRASQSWPLHFTKLRAPAVSRTQGTVMWGTNLVSNVEMLTAICDQAQMRAGVHHAEFHPSNRYRESIGAAIGIVRAGTPRSLVQGPSQAHTQRTSANKNAWGWNNVEAIAKPAARDGRSSWQWQGQHAQAGFPPETAFVGWQGWTGSDILGLKLDLDQGTLTAYKNRTLVGVITTNLGVGPFCWYVDLRHAGQGMSIGWVPTPLAAARDGMAGKKQKL